LQQFAANTNIQFPFTDNVLRAACSGARYISAPTRSQNDTPVFEVAEKLGILFIKQSTRLSITKVENNHK
jgi:phosphoribosylaminoimidazolecarboxamide formyltransferase / IMP cyclohydrolase